VVKLLQEKKHAETGRKGSKAKEQLHSVISKAHMLGPAVDGAVLAFISIRCELEYADRNNAFKLFRDHYGEDLKVKSQ